MKTTTFVTIVFIIIAANLIYFYCIGWIGKRRRKNILKDIFKLIFKKEQ